MKYELCSLDSNYAKDLFQGDYSRGFFLIISLMFEDQKIVWMENKVAGRTKPYEITFKTT